MTEENKIKKPTSRTKSILKNTGKTLVTIVSPPIGFALFAKGIKNKIAAIAGGMMLSGFIGTVYVDITREKLYDIPQVQIAKQNELFGINGFNLLVCPYAFISSMESQTMLKSSDLYYGIWKKDAIKFEEGKYNLNLGPEDSFGYTYKKCLNDAEQNVQILEVKFRALQNQGDIFAMREAKSEYLSAQGSLKKVKTEYVNTRTAFEGAVSKMNSELEQLAIGVGQ